MEGDEGMPERDEVTAPDREGMMKVREEVNEHDDAAALDNLFPFEQADHWTYPTGARPDKDEEDWNKHSHLLVSVSQEVKDKFILGHQEDLYFKDRYTEEVTSPERVLTPSHFQKGRDGLLYFVDADWKNRLCVLRSKIQFILRWIHESPHESAHAGPFKFLNRLRELFFWTTLTEDADEFASTCDVCQKIKVDHRQKMGRLRPAHIP
jgi:hypothetical protein